MRRRLVLPLVFIVALAAGAIGATLAVDNEPQLGLDLQGGVSVVLAPTKKVKSGVIDQSIAIIRNRVDALGVAEPDISRQGDNIVVQLPGVKDQDRALQVVGQTAELRFRPVQSTLPPEDAEPDATTTTTVAPTTTTAPTTTLAPGVTTTTSTSTTVPKGTTPREQDLPDAVVTLPEVVKGKVVARYVLGPTALTGGIVRTARAVPPQGGEGWTVTVDFTRDGSAKFDEMAAQFVGKQVAIVLDGIVRSAPVIRQAEFGGTAVISGGTGGMSEREARDLALVLRYGSLPVELEQQEARSVSATLGRESLEAGLAAGFVGLGLVLLYMIVYYRALGLVVILGLTVWAALMYSIISLLGETAGLALSLAGATGIIVSVGVTVDSYVVFFERLKDEVRGGRSVRSSVERGFSRAFRTILAADFASFLGAGLLYWLTVGPVRGFAFFLGLSTLLDVIVAWFFTRPMVALVSRNRAFTDMPFLGVARGLAVEPSGGAS